MGILGKITNFLRINCCNTHFITESESIDVDYFPKSPKKSIEEELKHLSLRELAGISKVYKSKHEEIEGFVKNLRIEEFNEINKCFSNLKDKDRLDLWNDFIDNRSKSVGIKDLLKRELITWSGICKLITAKPKVFSAFLQGIGNGSSIDGLSNQAWTEKDMLDKEESEMIYIIEEAIFEVNIQRGVYTVPESI